MPDTYLVWKFVHLTGVVMLLGNITVTAIWKFFADRDGRPQVLGFAQKLITYTDWSMTVWGVVLTMAGGYGLALAGQYDLTHGWLLWSQLCFVAAGLIWMGLIVPIQIRSARLAHGFAAGTPVPEEYKLLSRKWIFWGLVSTVPLLAALWLMIARPG
ncbi:DUF2269 family protein [Sandarakinorhabdus rubra]|uniref:DUF2269 family protein n=1 Tax=Sandarakinorhabdus rubra TaxID=2672568 RepID=UPI0013D9D04D|nr:DUF2269 family protein [Sandarakinorhabdus rubra]